MIAILLAFTIAFVVGAIAVQVVRWAAVREQRFDRAHDRGGGPAWRPVPRVGGAGVALAVVAGAVVTLVAGPVEARGVIALVAPALLAFAVGVVDDIRPVAAAGKLVAMVGAGAFAWALGCRLETLPLIGVALPAWASLLATSLWFGALGAALDFVDGLDGLAAGLGAIGATSLGLVAAIHGDLTTAAVSWIATGALLGFWHHNRHPASIFLGDGGALLVGALLAGCSITVAERTTAVGDLAVLAAIAWPLVDLVTAVVRRIRRRALFRPDAEHLHHLLLARRGHAPAVVTIHVAAVAAAVIGLALLDLRLAAAAVTATLVVAATTTSGTRRAGASGRAVAVAAMAVILVPTPAVVAVEREAVASVAFDAQHSPGADHALP